MKCPACKKIGPDVFAVKDAAQRFDPKKKKLVNVPGYYCDLCCLSWFVGKVIK